MTSATECPDISGYRLDAIAGRRNDDIPTEDGFNTGQGSIDAGMDIDPRAGGYAIFNFGPGPDVKSTTREGINESPVSDSPCFAPENRSEVRFTTGAHYPWRLGNPSNRLLFHYQ